MQASKLEELKESMSMKIVEDTEEELWSSAFDLIYPCGQVELDEETVKHCVFAVERRDLTGLYRCNTVFYEPADTPVVFKEDMTG